VRFLSWTYIYRGIDDAGLSPEYDKDYLRHPIRPKPPKVEDECRNCKRVANLLKKIRELDKIGSDPKRCEVTAYIKDGKNYYVEIMAHGRKVLARMPKQHYRLLEAYMDGRCGGYN